MKIRWLFIMMLMLLLVGCSDPAQEKFKTAQFEEQQFNKPHAIELYQEIIARHPDSQYADKAKRRLLELDKTE